MTTDKDGIPARCWGIANQYFPDDFNSYQVQGLARAIHEYAEEYAKEAENAVELLAVGERQRLVSRAEEAETRLDECRRARTPRCARCNDRGWEISTEELLHAHCVPCSGCLTTGVAR
jgi:hypothetical protein